MNALDRTGARPSESRADQREAIAREAAEWVVRKSEGLTRTEQQRFDEWIAASRAHERTFAAIDETWTALNEPRKAGLAAHLERELIRRGTQRHRRYALIAVGMAAALAFGIFASRVRVAAPPASTVVVRPDRQTLADGSVVEVKAGARIDVSFSPEQRGVRLLQGEVLFHVAKEAARPFVVRAGDLEVRAVGTAFAVSHHAEQVAVLVTEGRVAVERKNLPAASAGAPESNAATYMEAGDQLVVPTRSPATTPLAVTAATPAQIAAGLAWRGKRVEFTGTSVAEAIALFNRQNSVQLTAGDPTVARLQLSGIYWADDPEGFVRLLESGMNVRAERAGSRIVLHSR